MGGSPDPGEKAAAALSLVTFIVFGGPPWGGVANGLAYPVFPFIIWAGLRFGPVGSGGHVFNLGHGISQFTPIEAVSALVDEVHSASRAYHNA